MLYVQMHGAHFSHVCCLQQALFLRPVSSFSYRQRSPAASPRRGLHRRGHPAVDGATLWSAEGNREPRKKALLICRCSPDDLKQSATGSASSAAKSLGLFAVGAALLLLLTASQMGATLRSSVMGSWLGRSGFVAALSLIFLSEIGDKTFFICAILAMRLGRWISFTGTVLALGVMTLLSVGLGVAFKAIPDAMRTSIPIGKYLSVALLFVFGVRSIGNGLGKREKETEGDEMADAEEAVERAEQSGQVVAGAESGEKQSTGIGLRALLRSVFVVAALIFVAEWGDRSMLTTIALGASQSPLGVALGGIVGHTMAAMIAVMGGSFISNFISENTVSLISGVLFIVFAITTALNWT